MKNAIVKYGSYGILTGFLVFTLHLVIGIDNFDYTTNEVLGYLSIFLSLSFIYFAIKHYRDTINNGVVSLGKGIIIGVLISVLVGIGIGIADFIYTKYINPDFFSNYEEMLRKQGREDEIMEMTSSFAALFMIVLVTIIGFIISLVSALFLQRK
ncbi:DUF4199 domain-containing protein [Tenacibaculum amylolyticum]|uniref:DUF4199 domain-containing protein n=1 Tax=Tenacibaculum amylolyticum TaxID=104269 RepID=UPI003894C3BF